MTEVLHHTPRYVGTDRSNRGRRDSAQTVMEQTQVSNPARMFITVKYADNQSLVCNPRCSIINLLTSIKDRTGNSEKNMLIDLSDETGLIQDLEARGREYATKYLSGKSTYILMEKQAIEDDQDGVQQIAQYHYIPLLEQHNELYPNFKVHLPESQTKKLKLLKNVNKSPSPAGKMGTKSSTVTKSGNGGRAPRSSARTKSKER